MAESQFLVCGSAGQSDNTTRFAPVHGTIVLRIAEAEAETPIRDAGTFSHLFARVSTNTASVNSTITLRKSRASTALTVTFGPDETGFKEDTTNSASFLATDEVDYQVVVPNEAGTNTMTMTVLGVRFVPDDSGICVQKFGPIGTNNISTASSTFHEACNGPYFQQTDIDSIRWKAQDSFTLSDLWVVVASNPRTTNTTFRTRKNGADGGQSVTYAGSETGAKEDTTGSDSLVSGDVVNFSYTTGTGTETLVHQIISVTAINNNGRFPLFVSHGNGVTQSFGLTRYHGSAGAALATPTGTEAFTQFRPQFTFTARSLQVSVSANTITTSNTNFTVRDNGADSSITVAYAPAETGRKEDTTNTAEITSGVDFVNYVVVTPNTSGSITTRVIGILGEVGAPPPPTGWGHLLSHTRNRMVVEAA